MVIASPVSVVRARDCAVACTCEAKGANYDGFVSLTEEILSTPGLCVALMGDFAEMTIRLRGVLEVVGGQVLTPEMQEAFLESWLDDVQHKVAFATWGQPYCHALGALILR